MLLSSSWRQCQLQIIHSTLYKTSTILSIFKQKFSPSFNNKQYQSNDKVHINSPRFFFAGLLIGCSNADNSKATAEKDATVAQTDAPEYFNLRPKLEKEYGYSHAVRIGNDLKILGAVSMNDSGMIVAPGNMEQQMKNCYADLEKILQHYGYTFDDVVAENIYTTSMSDFIKVSGFRNSIYKKQFPTGTWLEVKGLAVEGQLIEIDMEAHKSK